MTTALKIDLHFYRWKINEGLVKSLCIKQNTYKQEGEDDD